MAAELEPVYLMIGSDEPKVALALRRLRARFSEGSIEDLVAPATAGQDAVAATNALGLFGGGERLVVVSGIGNWRKADVQAVVAYLQSPTPGAVLALLGDVSRLDGLAAACDEAGRVLRFDIPKRAVGRRETDDYAGWIQAQLERQGVTIERGAADRLVEIVGDDALTLESEARKLVTWSGDDEIGIGDVERLATPGDEEEAFALVDSWGRRDTAGLLRACEDSRRLGREPFVIAARVAEYVRRARAIKRLRELDVALGEIAKRLGMKDYPARKQASQVEAFRADELDAAVGRLAELDHALKGGSRLDPGLELERALVDISAARDHAARSPR